MTAIATAITFAATSCTASDPEPDQTANSVDGIDWTSCGPALEFASVPVPVDWSEPEGEQITLAVIRHPASNPDERIGTMFVEPGGPGDTGVGLVKNSRADLDAMVEGRFDIIGWDPRGTYGSSPMHWFEPVRDLDHLRALLCEDQITYMGLSYGTLVGQVYANMFPEHLRDAAGRGGRAGDVHGFVCRRLACDER